MPRPQLFSIVLRGPGAVERFAQIEGTAVKGLCDVEPDRVENCQKLLEKFGRPRATAYSGSTEAYKEMCRRNDIDLIYIATDWVHHVPIALYAMEHGKHVAIPDFTRGAWNRIQGFRYAFKKDN